MPSISQPFSAAQFLILSRRSENKRQVPAPATSLRLSASGQPVPRGSERVGGGGRPARLQALSSPGTTGWSQPHPTRTSFPPPASCFSEEDDGEDIPTGPS